MIKVERKVYEKVIRRIAGANDAEELAKEFSRNPELFFPILKDISRGKKSPNYRILKKAAGKESREEFITGRAKSILSRSAPDDDYDKVLSELRRHWLNLLNIHHPDKTGEKWLSVKERIEEVYEALKDPMEERKRDPLSAPVMLLKEPLWKRAALNRFVSLIFFISIIGICSLFFYAKKSGSILGGADDETGFVKAADEIDRPPETAPSKAPDAPPDPGRRAGAMRSSPKGPSENKSRAVSHWEKPEAAPLKDTVTKTKTVAEADDTGSGEGGYDDKVRRPEKIMTAQGQESPKEATQAEQKDQSERGPVRVEELITARGKWMLDFNILYSNIDTASGRTEILTLDGPSGQPILIPVYVGDQVTDQDFISYVLNIRYGLTDNLEIFAFSGFFSDFLRTSLNGENHSDSDFNFNFGGVGATYQIRREDRYPALLASASVNIADNTNFGDDDYEVSFFKTFTGSLVSYYTVDPIVFFLQGIYQQNFERKNGISIDPGEFFSLSPQIFFIVNPFINLTGGFRWRIQGADEINNIQVNSTRTSISPLFGVTYGVTDDLIISLDTEYRSEARIDQAIASLRFTYMF